MLQAKVVLSCLVLMSLFSLLQATAKRPPVQPRLERFCALALGVLLLSLFPQFLWWIWSVS